jgi:hypothetical protein
MKKVAMAALGALLIGGTTIHTTTASVRHVRQVPSAASKQFRNVYASTNNGPRDCEFRESGNPYDMRTDYQGWSSWRQLGAWNSRNDCN